MAVVSFLSRLYSPLPKPLSAAERNRLICERYKAGESQADLARMFGLSYQRIFQIVRGRNH